MDDLVFVHLVDETEYQDEVFECSICLIPVRKRLLETHAKAAHHREEWVERHQIRTGISSPKKIPFRLGDHGPIIGEGSLVSDRDGVIGKFTIFPQHEGIAKQLFGTDTVSISIDGVIN